MGSFAVIALKLLGIWGWLKQAAASAFRWALGHPKDALLILAVCALFWQHRAIGQRDAVIAARDARIAALIKASDEAAAKQAAQNRTNIGVQSERNKEVTHDLAIVEAARRDAVRDYAAANRCVMRPKGDQRPAVAAGVHPDPQGAAIAGPVADMVAVTPQDLDSLASSALRGATCTGFLNTLVDEGLAVGD